MNFNFRDIRNFPIQENNTKVINNSLCTTTCRCNVATFLTADMNYALRTNLHAYK